MSFIQKILNRDVEINKENWIGKSRVYSVDGTMVYEEIVDIGDKYMTIEASGGSQVKRGKFQFESNKQMAQTIDKMRYRHGGDR